MSRTAAEGFITRMESDDAFAGEMEGLRDDPAALLARVRAEGFDVAPPEILEVFLDRFGADLSPEQLDAIAAGADNPDWGLFAGVAAGATVLPALTLGAAAAAASA